MAGDQAARDRVDDGRDGDVPRVSHADLHQAVAFEQRQPAHAGNEGGIVEIDAQKFALLLHDADHAVAFITDLDALAERIGDAEQFALELGAEDDKGARAGAVVRRQEVADAHPHRIHLLHVGADAEYRGAAHAAVGAHFGVAVDVGGDMGDVGQAGERGGVIKGQLTCSRRQAGRAAARTLAPGVDLDDVGAELAELLQHEAVQTFANRGQQDDCGNADGDATQGQRAAQAVGGDRAQGQLQQVTPAHRSGLLMFSASSRPGPGPGWRHAWPA